MHIGVVVALAGSVGLASLAAASEEARRVWVDPPAVLQSAPGATVAKDALQPAPGAGAAKDVLQPAPGAGAAKDALQAASTETPVVTKPALQQASRETAVGVEPVAQQASSSGARVETASTPEALPDDEAPLLAVPPAARADFRASRGGPGPQDRAVELPAPASAVAPSKARKTASPDRLGILGGFAPYARAQAAQPAERIDRPAPQIQGALVRVRVIHFRKGRVLAVYTRS